MNKIIIGIDIGGSTTKIVGYVNGEIFSPLIVKATEPIASVYGAFGKFMSINKLSLDDIERVMITGVGSYFITDKLYGIPTGKVDEFLAVGIGGQFLSGFSKAIIVSMGTGTALVIADGSKIKHLGGTGIGGGTLLGLSNKMLNLRNFDDIVDKAKDGVLSNVDLTIGDITGAQIDGLLPHTTASNFGKISDLASRSDIALGIINLVFETIGMFSVFASRMSETKDVILTGNLINVPQAHDVFDRLHDLFGVDFLVPKDAEYATAAGAAIAYSKNRPFMEID